MHERSLEFKNEFALVVLMLFMCLLSVNVEQLSCTLMNTWREFILICPFKYSARKLLI